MTYKEKLLDPRWQKKRLEVFDRDKFTCLMCKSDTDTLHVHHEKYCKNPWDVDSEHLITLCFRCHEIAELCKKVDINYTNVNRLSYPEGIFIYLVNSPTINGENTVTIIDNLEGAFSRSCFPLSKKFVQILLNTF